MPPRFNISPGSELVVIRHPDREPSEKEMALLKWGLVPWWSKDPKIAYKTINARSETVTTAPAFRDAMKSRRCLVVVDGFYEWKKGATAKAPKQAKHVRLPDSGLFALAGLWETWKSGDGEVVETCTIVTTPSHGAITDLHDRMPLVLAGEDRDRWLGTMHDASDVLARSKATQEERAAELVMVPVGRRVNDVRNDDPSCLEPPSEEETAPAKQTVLFD